MGQLVTRQEAVDVFGSRSYVAASEGRVRKTAETGPDSIIDDCHRTPYADVDLDSDHPLIELLLAAGQIVRA